MKKNKFLDGMSNLDPKVVENFVEMDDRLQNKANKPKPKSIWLRVGIIAASLAVILCAMLIAFQVYKSNNGDPSKSPIIGDATDRVEDESKTDTDDTETKAPNDTSVGILPSTSNGSETLELTETEEYSESETLTETEADTETETATETETETEIETETETDVLLSDTESLSEMYKFEILNPDRVDILCELKDSYAAGEEIVIKLGPVIERYYKVFVNGIPQYQDNSISDLSITCFKFIMPPEDVVVEIEMVVVGVPVYSESDTEDTEELVFDFDFHTYLDEMLFVEGTGQEGWIDQVSTYKYEGEKISKQLLGYFFDGCDGGGYNTYHKLELFGYSFVTKFYDEENYAVNSGVLYTTVALEGLDLPSGITFEDNLFEVLKKLKVNAYSEEYLSSCEPGDLIIYEGENEVFKLQKLEKNGFLLLYTENYPSENGEATRKLSMTFYDIANTLDNFYVSVDEKWPYPYGESETLKESETVNTETVTETNTETEIETETETDFPLETSDSIIDYQLLTLSSEDEYNEFLNSNELPADFVPYDKINAIGDFEGLVILSNAYSNDYSSYMYSLVDSEGFEFVLYVDHKERESYLTDSVSNVNTTDMRALSDDSKGFYVYNDITYEYILGKLLSIVWEDQNIIYTLSGDTMLFEYPLTDSTFIGKMLNTDTALQALNDVFN